MTVWTILSIIFIALYVYAVVASVGVVLLENRQPQKAAAWVLILLFVPVFGLVFYLIFGQDIRRRKLVSKKRLKKMQRQLRKAAVRTQVDERQLTAQQQHLISLLQANCKAVPYSNNEVELYRRGSDVFDAIFEAIGQARHHVHVEFFIIEDDVLGNRLRELLIQKAREGVEVRVIYDYLGSLRLSKQYLSSLREAGVEIMAFMPVRFEMTGRIRLWGRAKKKGHINFRNHRKVVVVDGQTAFTGGHNVADRYVAGNELGLWRDTFCRIRGAAAAGLQTNFLIDWYFVSRQMITDSKYYPAPTVYPDDNIIQIVPSGPDSDWENIMQGLSQAVLTATHYIYIHTPYFMPPEKVLSAIHVAALSGVDVRLILPERSDASFSDAASRTYIERLLKSGVKVYFYTGGFLHSKAIVIDDMVSLIGSANLDERSANQHFELDAFVFDVDTAVQLRQFFMDDLGQSREIILREWMRRPRRERLHESWARLFAPLM